MRRSACVASLAILLALVPALSPNIAQSASAISTPASYNFGAAAFRALFGETTDASATLAKELGIPFTNFNDRPVLDVNVDGADEIAPGLALIKGGHGAHLREKIVASAARQFIVVADETKVGQKLGKFPLPVEVIHLALPLVTRQAETERHHHGPRI